MSDGLSSTAVELDLMVTAEVSMPSGYVFRAAGGNRLTRLAGLRPGADSVRSPCLAFAVRHPSAGTILIDTGMHPDVSRCLREDFRVPMSLLFRELRPADAPFDEQLRALGIEPGGVERVIMTHLHVDHTSGMRLLPNAEFTCSHKEWAATRKRFAAGKGYVGHHLPPESRMRLLDFERDGERHGPFAKTLDLLGDRSIRLISTDTRSVTSPSCCAWPMAARSWWSATPRTRCATSARASSRCSPPATRPRCGRCGRSRRSRTATPGRSWCPPTIPVPGTSFAT